MKIAILGTGAGARCHADKLTSLGHEVTVGTRDPQTTLARTETDPMGTAPFAEFLSGRKGLTLLPFAEATAGAELIINGIDGANAVAALTAIGNDVLAGKVLIDYAVPYRYNPDIPRPWPTPWGVMPALDPVDSDSLSEQIQRALPDAKVVKAFVTQEQETVVDPAEFGGDHTIFVAGDHPEAKQAATDLLRSYGWTDILDLGALYAARGMEMYAHMHCAIGLALGGRFGVKVIR
ncbi:NADPH-dependent F420 reductase [Nocardia sp. NPDC050175]|uniref:NADPH-dependent F420 reductase n=1 Tax=Nocardia sp. NPDC050175 TaxID=3364317 RepID=UPI0037AD4300